MQSAKLQSAIMKIGENINKGAAGGDAAGAGEASKEETTYDAETKDKDEPKEEKK